MRSLNDFWVRVGAECRLIKYDQLEISVKKKILDKHALALDYTAQLFFDELRVKLHSSPLGDLVHLKSAAPECFSMLQECLENAKKSILWRAQQLRSEKEKRLSSEEGESAFVLWGLGAYVFGVISAFSASIDGIISGIVALFLGWFIYYVPGGLLGKFFIMPIIHESSNSKKRRKRLSTVALLENDASKL